MIDKAQAVIDAVKAKVTTGGLLDKITGILGGKKD